LVLAWITAASIRGGWHEFWSTVVWEGLSRLLPGYNDFRPYSWGEVFFHPFKLLFNTLPWSALALLTLRPGFYRIWDERGKDLLIALHCWVWPQMVFWSLITEHTPRHSFPLFPGLAGLAVMAWHAWQTERLPWRMPRVAPVRLLAGAAGLWLLVKVAYVEVVIPDRMARRQTRYKGTALAALVPPAHDLYLFQLRNEGLMFYYGRDGRTVVRADSPAELPQGAGPVFCILSEPEWRGWDCERPVELVQRLSDEQGDRVYLVRVF
jgi:hypothetical protein